MTDNPRPLVPQVPDEQAPTPPVPLTANPERALAIIPRSLEEIRSMAELVVTAGMVPKTYDNKPERIALGILHGLELGLSPMAALQGIMIINNLPTVWGDTMLALVRASGKLVSFEETVELDEREMPKLATCRVRRRGDAHDIVGTFSRSEAMQAGLWNKAGPWQLYKPRMLRLRARSYALRDGFPDVLHGLRAAEEVLDYPASGESQ